MSCAFCKDSCDLRPIIRWAPQSNNMKIVLGLIIIHKAMSDASKSPTSAKEGPITLCTVPSPHKRLQYRPTWLNRDGCQVT
jgi:hypothetical protein